MFIYMFCLFIRFVVIHFVFLYILALYVLSLYTFCCYTSVSLYVLYLYVLSLYVLSLKRWQACPQTISDGDGPGGGHAEVGEGEEVRWCEESGGSHQPCCPACDSRDGHVGVGVGR
jgi:hypothetical protein